MFLIAPKEPFLSIDNDRNCYFPLRRCYSADGATMVFGSRITALPSCPDAYPLSLHDGNELTLVLAAAFTQPCHHPWGWCVGAIESGKQAFMSQAVISPLKSDSRTPDVETLRCWCHLDNAIVFEEPVTGSLEGVKQDIASLYDGRFILPGDLVFWPLQVFDKPTLQGHRLEFGINGVGILKLEFSL